MHRYIVLPTAPVSPIVFCGIGVPHQFFARVRAAGVVPADEIEFRDHHAYDRDDIERLLAARREFGAAGFLTTEKDAINLGPLQSALEPLAVAVLRVTLENPNHIVDTILTRTNLANITEAEARS
jgi:tetraacyldisaccharide 4'-kinase